MAVQPAAFLVGDGEVQPILPRNLEIHQRRVEPADLHHVDDEVRAGESFPAVHCRHNLRLGADRLGDLAT